MNINKNLLKPLILIILLACHLSIWASSDINRFSESPTAWGALSHEFKLDRKANSPAVKMAIKRLLADPKKLNHILSSASPYIYYIHQQTKAHGLPAEIALIPFIESEFNPNDHSTKGATGLWQMMPGTARQLHIKIRPGYDGRRNLVASTQAALAYLNDLGHTFKGNWYLAFAAYNAGQAAVQSATRRYHSKDFWDIHLPTETEYYVPKLLAIAEIVKNPQKYHVNLPPIPNKPYFTERTVKKSVSLTQAAKSFGVSTKTLAQLNPDMRNHIVAINGTYKVLVPSP